MSPVARKPPDDPVLAKLDEISRLLALSLKRDRPLSEVIVELASVGFRQKRISELVGTSPGYVDNVVVKARKDGTNPKRTTAPRAKAGKS